MRRTRAEVYLHFVWATAHRERILCDHVERAVHRCLSELASQMGCTVIAINGMPDHVHVLLRVPAKHSPASVANQLEGASARLVARTFTGCEHFAWQEGHGVFSLSRNDLDRVAEYIRRQQEHHAAGKVWPSLEASSEDANVDSER